MALQRNIPGKAAIAAVQYEKEGKYWLDKFTGNLQKTFFPYDYPKSTSKLQENENLDTVEFEFSHRLGAQVMELSKGMDHRIYITLTTGLVALLYRYTGNTDIIIGSPIFKQQGESKFVNTILALRNQVDGDITFKELLLNRVRQTIVEASQHQNYPLETLIFQLNMPLDREGFPLFDLVLLLENIHDRKYILPIQPNMIFSFLRTGGDMAGKVEYNPWLYEKHTIQAIIRHFQLLLENATFNLDIPISAIDILSEDEKKQLLEDFNNTRTNYPAEKTIDEIFSQQVNLKPNETALTYEGETVTYSRLNRDANALATYLHFIGVKFGDPVIIMAENSSKVIVAILGILKVGGVYVPINIDYPLERKRLILLDCNARVLLTNRQESLTDFPVATVVNLDESKIYQVRSREEKSIIKRCDSHDLAYIMYTSGSTGKPKGVMVAHKSVVRLVKNNTFIRFEDADSILQTGALEFDASTFEIWGALLNGLTLHLVDRDTILNFGKLKQAVIRFKVTIMWMTAPFFNQVLDTDIEVFKGLKNLLVGGDVLSPAHINRLRKQFSKLNIINGYGPTENTTFSTTFRIDREYHENIPIGRPISNSLAYILGSHYQLTPIGAVGELFVGGDGLSRGYLNNPELTAEKFIFNRSDRSQKTYILYKTGDLARWLPDGNIEFLGRVDSQVKIRGYRVEPGEIENRLLQTGFLKDAVVLVKKNRIGEKYLCAYVVPVEPLFETATLKKSLAQQLPDYMVPAYFVQLNRIPLTINGKIDRQSLPEPGIEIGSGYIAPRNNVENRMVRIWAEVLGRDAGHISQLEHSIGIEDNFFELGGHSLKATILISKLHKAFNVNIPLAELFSIPTIRELSNYILQSSEDPFASIQLAEKKEYYCLSSAQKRLYILQQMSLTSSAYNVPLAVEIDGQLEVDILEGIFSQLLARHESLRTSFHLLEEEPIQKIHDQVDFNSDYFDLSILPSSSAELFSMPDICDRLMRPFDLSAAPLLRVMVIKPVKERHILLVNMHHIVTDGTSMGLFIREAISLYGGERLPILKFQYKDYAEWQISETIKKTVAKQEKYWLMQFNGEVPVLNLPFDYPRPEVQSFEGNSLLFDLSTESTIELNLLAQQIGSTLYMALLSIYSILLTKLSGQEDIIVGTPIAARRHADLEKIIGMFVNTLALRNYPEGHKGFVDFLLEVKEKTLEAYENQEYQFEDLVEKVLLKRDASRNPIFDTMLTLQNFDTRSSEIPQAETSRLKIKPYEIESEVAKFDLSLTCTQVEEKIVCSFNYCTKLFKKETIQRFAQYFKQVVSTIIENKNKKISELEIITGKEKLQLLYEFNDTMRDFPGKKTICQLFEEQVGRVPYRIALCASHMSHVTYIELDNKSCYLAGWLIQKGVKPDSIVGIVTERSIEIIIGILGILKSGGAYLPIDPEYPQERVDYMLKDSGVKLLVSANDKEGEKLSVRRWEGKKVLLEAIHKSPKISSYSLTFLPSYLQIPSNLAYLIYTSGSTGRPKAVMVEHRNVVRLVKNTNYVEFRENDRLLQTGALEFDASTFEIWGSLLNGMTLCIAAKDEILNPERLKENIRKLDIATMWLTSPLFNQLSGMDVEIFVGIKNLLVGGDVLSPVHINRVKKRFPHLNIINGYGPTENTTFSTTFLIDEEYLQRIPIGKPIFNSTAYVVDKYGFLVPVGVSGELLVGGAGVSRGYLNNPELTVERFKRDAISQSSLVISSNNNFSNDQCQMTKDRFYKTGDLARWLSDGPPAGGTTKGIIEYLGRIDEQVKIRGFRIECGEIENRLIKYSQVKEAVVLVKEDENKGKYLIAYYVANSAGDDIPTAELKQYLAQHLPDYMVPSYFIQIERIPLNPNGKIDRKALPEPLVTTGSVHTAPKNEIEAKLVKIWSGILGIQEHLLGVDTNFFEVGGHSLKATVVVSNIHKVLGVKIPLMEIFKNPTIRELAVRIHVVKGDKYTSLEPVEKKEYYVLSPAQTRLYILQQMELESTVYNMPQAFHLFGKLDEAKLATAFKKLIKRHESLRTFFPMIESEPVQRINDEAEFEIETLEVRNPGLGDIRGDVTLSTRLSDFIKNFIRPFDLTKTPLLRVGLVKEAETEHVLVVDMHHIISDGVSNGILIRDFLILYNGDEPKPVRIQYKDFSEWQNSEKKKEEIARQGAYWLKVFTGEVPVLNIFTDYPRPSVQSFVGRSFGFALPMDVTGTLKRIAASKGATLYMTLLALYNVLLAKLTNQEDIIIGTPIAGRRHADLEKTIGMFVNTLALRNYPGGNKKFGEFLTEVGERTLEAFENQEYQFEDLVEMVSVNRDASRNPIFDTMFTFQNLESRNRDSETPQVGTSQLKVKPYEIESEVAKFDLILGCTEVEQQLVCSFNYCIKLFKKETIQRFAQYFNQVVLTVIENINKKISEVEIISVEEKQQLLYEFNDPTRCFPEEKNICQLFEEQVARTPDGIALFVYMSYRSYGAYITYSELNKKSGHLAHLLIRKGVQSGDIVGLLVERSFEMITGILGIWKAGCAYAPLNPKAPVARNEYMLAECGARFLLTSSNLRRNFEYLMVLDFEHLNLGIVSCFEFRASNLNPSNLAYIIFTSGSTGNPKGVLITHANLSPLLHWGYHNLGIGIHDRTLQNLSYYFDWSVWEIFITLTTGASLYISPEGMLLDAVAGVDFINRHGATILHATPTQYQYFVKAVNIPVTLKYLFIGAEKLSYDLVERSFASVSNGCRVFNMYGPTEATIISAVLEIHRESLAQFKSLTSIPIGKSAGNTIHLILDKYNNLCPVNIAGELYIGGDGVSMGYLNNPELTADKFYRSYKSYKTYIFYKTGDLARWLSDGPPAGGATKGIIEYLGRIDEQVKIRGFRIELGEIENRLLHYPGIKEAVILVKEDENKDKYLIAYFVAKVTGNEVLTTELKQYLAQHLPDYMVPAYFIQIERIPLNPNGKIDRKALPEPIVTAVGAHTAPQNEIEAKLLEIWSGILGIQKDQLGVDTNFFDIGGHSLKATIMAARVHKTFNVKTPVIEIFKNPTIRELSAFIQGVRQEKYLSIEPVEKKDYYVLSSAQKRLYILQQMELESVAYNMPQVFHLSGALDSKKLKVTFGKLIQRHDSLRTSFHMLGRDPVQKVLEEVEFKIECYDLAAKNAKEREVEKLHHSSFVNTPNHFIRAFDLSRAPLLRVGLVKEAETEHVLAVDMHHIISDGVSNGILIRDFFALYNGDHLEPVRIQYKDFSEWQYSEKERIKKQEAYWLNVFEGEVPALNIFTDYPRPVVQSFEGRSFGFTIPSDATAALKGIVAARGVTLYMLLLAVYNILLARLTGQEDIVIGTPIAGRRHADLEKTIGMFVNTLALRNYPEGHMEFVDFLSELKISTLDAFENQEYQFEDLVEKVLLNRDVSRNPIFDTMFSLQNLETQGKENARVETSQLKIIPYEIETGIAKFDLILTCTEVEEKLVCSFTYCTKLFKEETMRRFAAYFKQVVSVIIGNAHQKIAAVEIITEEKKLQLLYEFNGTTLYFPEDKNICRLFEEQVARTPDGIVLFEYMSYRSYGSYITYSELNKKSGHLAHLLIRKDVQSGDIVGLLVERSLEMLAGILGIWKAGCAYMPINPRNPGERSDFMLIDSGAKILVTASNKEGEKLSVGRWEGEKLFFEDISESPNNSSYPLTFLPSYLLSSSNLAYVIYTSGSTGNPKGVLITHANLSPLLHWGYHNLGIGIHDRTLQNLSYYFDWSVWEIFITLTSGASLCMVSEEVLMDAAASVDFMNRHGVTILHVTPTQYQYIVKAPTIPITLKSLFIGAEKLTYDLVERSFASVSSGCRVFNMYGPTEATIISAVLEIERESLTQFVSLGSIPIGESAGNTVHLILDKYNNVCPVNIAGELYIGGDGVSMGYLNNPELTNQKFLEVSEPFFKKVLTRRRQRFYRTGDLARWLSDGPPVGGTTKGIIEYLGRIDEQVKIRGFRIELGEIENRLLHYPGIKDAVVLVKEDEHKDKYLIAYFVASADKKEVSASDLRQYLLQQLPDYMIPTYFMSIEKIPLNPNGKIDRKTLPDPVVNAGIKEEFTVPRNEIERKLSELWSEILGQPSIGIDANFFEIGGHSLKATAMTARVYEMFKVKVPLAEVFIRPSIRHLAEYIAGMEKEAHGIADPYVVLLRKGSSEVHHLFLVHDGSGEVEGYLEFCQQFPVDVDLNIWGLRTDVINRENCGPRNITIEKLAEDYIEKIKKVQPKGPYRIVGWSLGGTIAFEMVLQLERLGEAVSFLGLLDAPGPQGDWKEQAFAFTPQSEKELFLEYWQGDNRIHEEVNNRTDMNEIWSSIVNFWEENHYSVDIIKAMIPDYLAQIIPNYQRLGARDLIYYLNIGRTLTNARLDYIPSRKIITELHYFKANQSPRVFLNSWNDYCANPVKTYEISGTHFSILKSPAVIQTWQLFVRALSQE
ncbi:MAG: hypothetical protein QG657_645 [Acidobacteriota bacterium]|nr:hypothetical protein [Acidobacteriota bacterium]